MDNHNLIASIYAATLSPHGFDELVDDMESQVVEMVRAVTGLEDFGKVLPATPGYQLAPAAFQTLARHVEKAQAIQERLGRGSPLEQRIDLILETQPNPAFVIHDDERIFRINALASRDRRVQPRSLADMFPEAGETERIRKGLASVRRDRDFASVPVNLEGKSGRTRCVLLKRLTDPALPVDEGPPLFLVTIVDFGFDEDVARLVREAFELTEAEAAVSLLLAGGLRPEEIARRRSVSLQTVRTQIRSIKHKTKVGDLPDLVRLLCGFSAGLVTPSRATRKQVQEGPVLPELGSLVLSGGRRIDYVVQGKPGGKPVILLHNMPYGQRLPSGAVRQAAAMGLMIVAPFRPGYRGTAPAPVLRRNAWLDSNADDLAEIMDQLGMKQAALIGNVAGASLAVRFATRHPDRAAGILMVSRAPIWRGQWLADLPQRQRLISMLLWIMPKMADVLVWAILSHMNRHGAESYIRASLNGGKADHAALDDPETLALLESETRAGLANGGDAFCRDWETMDIDLTEEARALPNPIHILHGADDRIVRHEYSVEFVREVPQATLEIVQGAGHFLLYSHWKKVVEALRTIA